MRIRPYLGIFINLLLSQNPFNLILFIYFFKDVSIMCLSFSNSITFSKNNGSPFLNLSTNQAASVQLKPFTKVLTVIKKLNLLWIILILIAGRKMILLSKNCPYMVSLWYPMLRPTYSRYSSIYVRSAP